MMEVVYSFIICQIEANSTKYCPKSAQKFA